MILSERQPFVSEPIQWVKLVIKLGQVTWVDPPACFLLSLFIEAVNDAIHNVEMSSQSHEVHEVRPMLMHLFVIISHVCSEITVEVGMFTESSV